MRGHRLGLGLSPSFFGGTGPILASIQPNFMPADALAPAIITGAWAGTVTAVTIGGVAATIVSQTSTTVKVTVPAGTASATGLDVVVTASGKTGKLAGGFWYLPGSASAVWDAYNYANLTFNGSTISAIADSCAVGYGGSQAVAAQQPTYVSSVASLNSRPALQYSGSQNLQGGTFSSTLVQPWSVVVVGALTTNTPGNDQLMVDGLSTGRGGGVYYASVSGEGAGNAGWSLGSNGYLWSGYSQVTEALNTAFCVTGIGATTAVGCKFYNGSTSLGFAQSAGVYGATGYKGLTWGSRYAASSGTWYGVYGYMALLLVYPRALSTTEVGIVASVMQQVFGSPT